MDTGELAIRWTARAMLLAAVAGLAAVAVSRRRPAWRGTARGLWTAGCLVYLVHVACAFHFHHHWSQQAALAWTVHRTQEVTGLSWDGGLYINYLFTACWVLDVLAWWLAPRWYAGRPGWLAGVWLAFFLFIAFNSTAVFERGVVRWTAVGLSLALAGLWWATGRPLSAAFAVPSRGDPQPQAVR